VFAPNSLLRPRRTRQTPLITIAGAGSINSFACARLQVGSLYRTKASDGMVRIPEGSAPDFKNKSWTVAAEMAIPENGASGVLAKLGGRFGGWGLLMQDRKPEFVYAFSNQTEHKFRVASSQPITPGTHVVRVAFRYDGGRVR
jgi:hypothetical protein